MGRRLRARQDMSDGSIGRASSRSAASSMGLASKDIGCDRLLPEQNHRVGVEPPCHRQEFTDIDPPSYPRVGESRVEISVAIPQAEPEWPISIL